MRITIPEEFLNKVTGGSHHDHKEKKDTDHELSPHIRKPDDHKEKKHQLNDDILDKVTGGYEPYHDEDDKRREPMRKDVDAEPEEEWIIIIED